MPTTNLGGGGDCFTEPCDRGDRGDRGDGGDGDSGGDGHAIAWTVILLDGPTVTAPAPVSGVGGSSFVGYSGGNPTYHYSPKTEKERLEQYAEGYYMAVSHPGRKDWNSMTNNERIAHILKAFKYAQKNKISLNLNHYFRNLPVKGNSGFGKQYKISGSVIINGQNIPITMELPIISSERVFNTIIEEGPKYIGNLTYTSQYNYYYGLGDRHKNSFTIFVPGAYERVFTDFII